MKTLFVIIKSAFGQTHIYPDCTTSAQLLALKGTKSFTASDIEKLKELGYEIKVKEKTL